MLVTGATSAIGLIGLQIAKALGAGTVIATTRSGSKTELLRSHGADVVIVTSREALDRGTLAATHGDGVDVALDHAGGQTLADCLSATREGGTIINIGRFDRAESTIDLDHLSYRRLTLRGASFGFTRAAELGNVIAALQPKVLPALADGRIQPVIDSVHPFTQAKDASDRLRHHNAEGKVVLTVPQPDLTVDDQADQTTSHMRGATDPPAGIEG